MDNKALAGTPRPCPQHAFSTRLSPARTPSLASQRSCRSCHHVSKRSGEIICGVTRREGLIGGLLPCCCGCSNTIVKDGWYDKFFAQVMATGMDAYEEAVAPFKFELLRDVRRRDGGAQSVLEIGIGAAPNLQYLTRAAFEPADGLMVTGIDPNPYMFKYARESAMRAGLSREALELKLGSAESLPAQDTSFDTIICTLVLCSVPDVSASAKEMRRVLKPGGKLYFLEHVAAGSKRPLLRAAQQLLTPVQQLLADGCHLNRNPLQSLEAAGFSSIDFKHFDVPGMGVIGPHVSGVAVA